MSRLSLWMLVFSIALAHGPAWGQVADLMPTEEEAFAWERIDLEQYISARETAEAIVREEPTSIIGHAALGVAQRYGEGNLPRSLYHQRQARRLLEDRFGQLPQLPGAAFWHQRILQETAFTAGEMERFEEELDIWDAHDLLYEPQMPGERIWPLMRLRRLDEARSWAVRALESGQSWGRRQALNGLCAIENEAGNRLTSYRWCTAHAEEILEVTSGGAVYLCNAGESARAVFRLDEAERYYLEAARHQVAWYANPWMSLADLYLRAGRLAQAAVAVSNMHDYARRRPPHTQQQDSSERYRAEASLLLVAGRPNRALPLTERAVRYPDRRGGQSRSPEADRVTAALLHRRALLDAAEVVREEGSMQGFFDRVGSVFRATWLRVRAWRASRQAVAILEDQNVLQGLLEAEGRMAQATPPWLSSELTEVAGPGPVLAAIAQARRSLPIEELAAYLDAYEAEAAAASSDWQRAEAAAERAVRDLPPGETLLKARAMLVRARTAESEGRQSEAASHYIALLQTDGTLLRRTGTALPLRIEANGPVSTRAARHLRRSPRVQVRRNAALVLSLNEEEGTCRVCLGSATSGGLECGTAPIEGDLEDAARRCAALFHETIMGARIDMSLLDPSNLDGSTTRGRSADDILGP